MNYVDKSITENSDAENRDTEEAEVIRSSLTKEHKVLSNEQIQKVIKILILLRIRPADANESRRVESHAGGYGGSKDDHNVHCSFSPNP